MSMYLGQPPDGEPAPASDVIASAPVAPRKRAPRGPDPLPIVQTQSSINLFRNCRRAYFHRYVQQIVPRAREERALAFGTLIHSCLETWHAPEDREHVEPMTDEMKLERIQAIIDANYPHRDSIGEQADSDWHDWAYASAMMREYARRYAKDDYEPVAVEMVFNTPMVNPDSGKFSRRFHQKGKVDGVVRHRIERDHLLLEHKTAAVVDGAYLEKLWTDLQLNVYVPAVERTLGIVLTGVLYNVLVKPRIERRKSRNPETPDQFLARLAEKLADPEMMHRETVLISRDQIEATARDVWAIHEEMLDSYRTGNWWRNTSYCFNYKRACPYFTLCKQGTAADQADPFILEQFYEHKGAHGELEESGPRLPPGMRPAELTEAACTLPAPPSSADPWSGPDGLPF